MRQGSCWRLSAHVLIVKPHAQATRLIAIELTGNIARLSSTPRMPSHRCHPRPRTMPAMDMGTPTNRPIPANSNIQTARPIGRILEPAAQDNSVSIIPALQALRVSPSTTLNTAMPARFGLWTSVDSSVLLPSDIVFVQRGACPTSPPHGGPTSVELSSNYPTQGPPAQPAAACRTAAQRGGTVWPSACRHGVHGSLSCHPARLEGRIHTTIFGFLPAFTRTNCSLSHTFNFSRCACRCSSGASKV